MGLVPAQLVCGNVKYTYELNVKLWIIQQYKKDTGARIYEKEI